MSGTETILLIVLGFSLASLIALFIGRMLWRAAVKVGARRMQRQAQEALRLELRAEQARQLQWLEEQLKARDEALAQCRAQLAPLAD